MAIPLRKNTDEQEELTTADLAQGSRTEVSEEETDSEKLGPRPVSPERNAAERNLENRRTAQFGTTANENASPLFPSNELENLRSRWSEIQTAFVDEPRKAVEQADNLVASAMKRLAEVFAEERSKLEKQWDRGDNVSTEDLRVALQRYRTFFQRLLSV
jgi:glutathione S-transferase